MNVENMQEEEATPTTDNNIVSNSRKMTHFSHSTSRSYLSPQTHAIDSVVIGNNVCDAPSIKYKTPK